MTLVEKLAPMAASIANIDLTDRQAAESELERLFPWDQLEAVRAAILSEHAAGSLTPREAGGVRFGRLAKPSDQTSGMSIDAVDISGSGAEHTHTKGEVSLCLPLEGDPVFEGVSKGWAVLPIGSHHAPTVTGGRMVILYFLPDGAVSWGPRTAS